MNNVLNKIDEESLRRARTRARGNAEEQHVGGYDRPFYRLQNEDIQRLARWADVETAILRLCKHINRHKAKEGDSRRATAACALLMDHVRGGADLTVQFPKRRIKVKS